MVLSRGWGWLGKINNKDHLSPAEAGRWAELGNMINETESAEHSKRHIK